MPEIVGTFLVLLLWHAPLVSIAVGLWWQLRHGIIWIYFGIHGAKRAAEPVAYWLSIAGTCFALLVVGWIVGTFDVAALQSHGWL